MTEATMRVNIYRHRGIWAYALWIDGDYDSSDTLEAESLCEARKEVAQMFPGAAVQRVDDVTT